MSENNAKPNKLDDDFLDAVMGGVSLYAGADGMDRDSWFVNLVRQRMPGGGRPNDPRRLDPRNAGPFATLFVGEYSSR